MSKPLFIIFITLLCVGVYGQTWEIGSNYDITREGTHYNEMPDSLIRIYRPKEDVHFNNLIKNPGISWESNSDVRVAKDGILWQKFKVRNTQKISQRYLIETDPNFYLWPKIDIYIIKNDSLKQHFTSGNEIQPINKTIRDRRNLFWLYLDPNEEKQIYIRYVSNREFEIDSLRIRAIDRQSLQDFEGYTHKEFNEEWAASRFQISGKWIRHSIEFIIDSTQNYTLNEIDKVWDQKSFFYRIKDYYPSRKYVLWCRLEIINDQSLPRNYFFDTGGDSPKVEAFLPDGNGGYLKKVTGKNVPLEKKPISSPLNFLTHTVAANDTSYIYLKYHPIRTNNSFLNNVMTTGIFFVDAAEVFSVTRKTSLWKGFLLGIFIFQFFYFLLRAILQHDNLGFYYALIIIGFLLAFIYIENLGNTFYAMQIFLEQSHLLIFLAFTIMSLGIYLFTNKYMSVENNFPRIYRLQSIILVVLFALQTFIYVQRLWYYNQDRPKDFTEDLYTPMLVTFGFFVSVYVIISIIGSFKKIPFALTYFITFGPFFLIGSLFVFYLSVSEAVSIFQSNILYYSFILTSILYGIIGARQYNQMRIKEVESNNLIKINKTKADFYSNITHEFRTPLTVIMGVSNLIKGHNREKELIQKNGQEVLNLVQQLLEISKAQSGALQLNLIEDNILLYLEYLIDSFRPLADEKNISIGFHYKQDEIIMRFDREKIRFILNNLLNNAIKFTPENGKIDIDVIQDDQKMVLSITDTGIGLSKSESEKIFDRYYRSKHNDVSSQVGDGIGLALVKELVEFLNGTIRVESKENIGSTFEIVLPFKHEENLALDEDKESSERRESKRSIAEDESIALIIEDNKDIQYYIERVLSENYKIFKANNGEEGLEIATHILPDIIISDVMMPKMDGYELTEKLKSDERTNHIPIILLTAKSAQEEKIKGLSVGADAYLNKPFNEEELKIRMKNLILKRLKLQSSNNSTDYSKREKPKDPFIEKVLELLELNYQDEDFGISQFVEEIPFSRMQVHRKLKALTGFSTSQFINDFRLRKAKVHLEQNQLNVSETAYACGFSDSGYFSKLFTKKYGTNPLAYKTEITAKNNS